MCMSDDMHFDAIFMASFLLACGSLTSSQYSRILPVKCIIFYNACICVDLFCRQPVVGLKCLINDAVVIKIITTFHCSVFCLCSKVWNHYENHNKYFQLKFYSVYQVAGYGQIECLLLAD